MDVIRGVAGIKKRYKNPVVAIGVFDGVHLGHRKILKDAVRIASRINGTSMVVTFWPHPKRKETLYSLDHRLRLIAQLGINICVVHKFDRRFARIPPVDFIEKVLVGHIRPMYVCVGENFRFGNHAAGDVGLLRRASGRNNFKLKCYPVRKFRGLSVSSTSIRRLIKSGNIKTAGRLLEYPVSILGTVVKGSSLARTWGIPTANINPHHEVVPASGVYTVKVNVGNKLFGGICYIGKKPAIRKIFPETKPARIYPANRPNIEVHIFNFNKDIYKKTVEIQFVRKMRNERAFNSLPGLIAQIKKDAQNARIALISPPGQPLYMPTRYQ